LGVLKGESADNFANQIGTFLLKNSNVIAEAAPENLLSQIAQNLILTTKEALEIVSSTGRGEEERERKRRERKRRGRGRGGEEREEREDRERRGRGGRGRIGVYL
jgi:hypothetical protein